MKKILVLIATIVCTFAATAQSSYKHSAGLILGTMEGVSYKGFLTDNLAIQGDLVFKFLPTSGTSVVRTQVVSTGSSHTVSLPVSFAAWTFEANPNLVYQKQLVPLEDCILYWYAGGGVSLGMGSSFSDIGVLGKWGVNAIGGLELGFDIPLSIFFDFRPGYGMLFEVEKGLDGGPLANRYTSISIFDWGIGIGARYCM